MTGRWFFWTAMVCLAVQTIPGASAQSPVLTQDVDYVQVPVTVMDRQGHVVTTLQPENFRVYQDGIEIPQRDVKFSADAVPVSFVFVVDLSASVTNTFLAQKEAVLSV